MFATIKSDLPKLLQLETARKVLHSASAAWTITPGQTPHYMWVDSASLAFLIRRKLRRTNNLVTASVFLPVGIGVN
jgi:hypothetical protein